MSKDPAVLFYTSDFISGTLTMTDEQKGKYIILLCLQHQQGELSNEDMLNICKSYDKKIFDKFIKTEEGNFYNERMKIEADRRKKYSESRSNNRKTSKTYVKHMETENETINKDIDLEDKKGVFEIFRLKYPGTKRGIESEFNNFKSKHKDWKDILPILLDKLDYQIKSRDTRKQNGVFVPEWKILQTWINQRCWEEEINVTEKAPSKFEQNVSTKYIKE